MDAAFSQITSAFGGIGGGGGDGGWLSNLLGRNSGGLITGGSGTRDDVPTLLTGGEFVIRRGAVEKYGTQFFEGLNTGRVGQMQRGGLYTPGTYGQGAIQGKGNLLDFATQSFTGGQFDQIGGGAGFGSVSLEPQSGALTMFGRRNSPLFQKEQQSKEEAFGLFVRQTQYEEQLKEQERERKKAFMNSLLAAAGSVAMNQFATGFSESMKGGKGLGASIGAGFTGFEFEGKKHGGLFNWTGGGGKLPSITRAERTKSMQLAEAGRPIPKAIPVGESSGGASGGAGGGFLGGLFGGGFLGGLFGGGDGVVAFWEVYLVVAFWEVYLVAATALVVAVFLTISFEGFRTPRKRVSCEYKKPHQMPRIGLSIKVNGFSLLFQEGVEKT